MINDSDIQNYLGMIDKSKTTRPGVQDDGDAAISIDRAKHVIIDPGCDIRGIERMSFGKGVVIQKDCWLNIAFQKQAPGPMILIGEGTNIGRRCIISAANSITIGKYVLLAPNVFIADTHHAYQQIGVPIMYQGITTHEDRIEIGDETWIGINAVVMGNVTIGKHCVIGANSVVNRDIPDYCVAVGNPARVVKSFDPATQEWVKVSGQDALERFLAARGELSLDGIGKTTREET